MNKKAQGMSTSTIVILILAVVVLVVLILGFTMGWDKLAPWLSSENVDDVKNQCTAARSTDAEFTFCSKLRTLNTGDEKFETTCAVLANAGQFDIYGIDNGAMNCNLPCETIEVNGLKGIKGSSAGYDVGAVADIDVLNGETCFVPFE